MNRILVIEDNEGDQFINEVTIHTEFPDVEIYKAYDGLQALEFLEKKNIEPEIILLDINMPRMNGLEFLEAYAEKHNGHIPVVVMLTSSDQEQDKKQSLSYDFVKDYFLKPLTAEQVQELNTVIQQFKTQTEAV